jgi:hypothetical protein
VNRTKARVSNIFGLGQEPTLEELQVLYSGKLRSYFQIF